MLRKTFSGLIFIVLLTGMLTFTFNIQPVKASGTIYIRSDGSIDPPTANITSADSVTYYFTDNNYDEIVVERSNIIINGSGYTLQGTEILPSKGIYLHGVNNVTIKNTNIKNFYYGVSLSYSSNNTVSGNNITNNNYDGVRLGYSSNNTVSGNNITNNNYDGVSLSYSSSNTVSGNNITNNDDGVYLYSSSNNTVSGNNITNNEYGVYLYSSSNNVVSTNTITNNFWGICLYSSSNNVVSTNTFINDGVHVWEAYGNVVEDNTVNGKPLIYLEDVQNYTIDYAGQVILINCNNITVQNLNLSNIDTGVQLCNTNNCSITGNNITNNNDGVSLSYSSSNTVSGNNITNNYYGARLRDSSNNNITGNTITNNWNGVVLDYSSNNNMVCGNTITNNYDGVVLGESSNNVVSGNTVTNNLYGISLGDSSNNSISGNTITNNFCGVYLYSSSNNRFYHNNINNTDQVYLTDSFNNTWDNGCEGNYWSNYNGTDLDGDGIGDTELPWEGVDDYPLMNPYWLPGDVNHDLKIDIYDVVRITAIYGSEQGDPNWNCHSDIAEPYGIINIYDVVTCTKDYRKEYAP